MNAGTINASTYYHDEFLRFIRRIWVLLKTHYELAIVVAAVLLYQLYSIVEDHKADRIFSQPQKSDFYFVDFHAIEPGSSENIAMYQ